MQARTSYLPSEILWGEKFLPVLQSDNEDAEFLVNFSMFNMTKKQKSMPNFSSREYQIRKKFHKLCMLKKYLVEVSKLSDAEGAADGDPETAASNHLSNLNLLRHLLNQNDTQNNLNGVINNYNDLNNLNNLLNTLNKLIGNSSNNCSVNGNSLFNNKDLSCGSFNGNRLSGQPSSNHVNASGGAQQFYQQSLSVDQAAMNRKKSTEISNLLDLLQQGGGGGGLVKPDTGGKSKSINFLNTVLNPDHLASQHSSHSVNNQCISGQCGMTSGLTNGMSNSQSNRVARLNQINSQMNSQMSGLPRRPFRANDSEHIQIEDDFLKASEASPERKRSSGLKLLSLFQPSPLDSQLVGYDNHNYNANYHSKSKNELNKLDRIGRTDQQTPASQAKSQSNLYVKSGQAMRKLKDQQSTATPPRPPSRFTVKSESFLNFNSHPNYGLSDSKQSEHTQSSCNLINGYLNDNLDQLKASRSEWNISANIRSVAKKRQFFRASKK